MAVRKPLVLDDSGRISRLQPGDTIDTSTSIVVQDLVSADPDNNISIGNDGKLFSPEFQTGDLMAIYGIGKAKA